MMMDFWEPFFANVLKRGGRSNGEADQEHISLRIRKGTKTIVIFLTRRIEEAKGIGLVADPEVEL